MTTLAVADKAVTPQVPALTACESCQLAAATFTVIFRSDRFKVCAACLPPATATLEEITDAVR